MRRMRSWGIWCVGIRLGNQRLGDDPTSPALMEEDMATRLKLYCPPREWKKTRNRCLSRKCEPRLGDLLPVVAMGVQRMNFIWLKDFLDDEVAVSQDLYEVMQAFRSSRPTSA